MPVVEAKQLQRRREAMGLSRAELATELHTTAVMIWRWENEEQVTPPHLEDALQTVERENRKQGMRKKNKVE